MEKLKQLNRNITKKMHVLENEAVMAWIILLGMCIFAYTIFFDNDGYFLIATGKEIVENGIPQFNPFFLEEGYRIVVQQWLWDSVHSWIQDRNCFLNRLIKRRMYSGII